VTGDAASDPDPDDIPNGNELGPSYRGSIVSEQKEASNMNDMPDPNIMLEATRLTRARRLTDATTLLQRMLRGETKPEMTFDTADAVAPTRGNPPIIDAKTEAIAETHRPLLDAASSDQPHMFRALHALLDRVKRRSGLEFGGLKQPAPVYTPDIVPEGGKFLESAYSNPAGSRAYKLYIPSRYQGQALPLVVMLHGCTQSPDDFAAGTRMNVIAEEQTCLVVYPEQPSDANPAKCWNWFRPTDQRRGQGEPSLVAGITRQVMRDYSVDPQRVYIGGLSAGAAAAAVMGATYPDLYAAIGVHSGLACGTANDLPSAFVAMQQGDLAPSSASGDISGVLGDGPTIPTIVFHGDRDTTVHPRNGDHVVAQSLRTMNLQKKAHRGRVRGGHAYTRTIHTDASGRVILEHWEIHGAGHAWSGGSPAGSYTDPRGPDATREMLRFFLEQPSSPAAL
jgi:poly(hydroxyalkanoate) depolymerase family esterase